MRRALRSSGWLVLLLGCCAAPGWGDDYLTVGPNWTAVSEERHLQFDQIDQTFLWDDVPAAADLTSLTFISPRFPVHLVSWTRAESGPARKDSDPYQWHAGPAPGPAGAWGRVSCRMTADAAGPHDVRMCYLTRGLGWSVSYNILVRGDLTNEQERISVDLDGSLQVRNDTDRSFRNVVLQVVGTDQPAGPTAPDQPGFLLIPESLVSLVLEREGQSVTYRYGVPGRRDLPARSETEIALVSTQRKPAERLYYMAAQDFPLLSRGGERPLERMIILPNDPGHGLGLPLPSGPARIYVGNFRTTLSRAARFSHTPASGTFRIDLGPAETVSGSRRYLGRVDHGDGTYEDSFGFQVVNGQDSSINVEIEDEPPTSLPWDIVSSTGRWEIRGRRLVLTSSVDAHGTRDLRYVIRVRVPSL